MPGLPASQLASQWPVLSPFTRLCPDEAGVKPIVLLPVSRPEVTQLQYCNIAA